MSGFYSYALRKSTWFLVFLLNKVTRPLAAWWWVGPLLVLFAWVIVPVMRRKHNIMQRDDYSRSTRFWWAPVWPGIGLTGLGVSLTASPLLNPVLAAKWEPLAWFGASLSLGLPVMGLLVIAGVLVAVAGLKMVLRTWLMDRETRYRAWRWRQGSKT